MIVQLGAIYRHRPTGRFMTLQAADIKDNTVELVPIGDPWAGTSQHFADEFELIAKSGPANVKVSDRPS